MQTITKNQAFSTMLYTASLTAIIGVVVAGAVFMITALNVITELGITDWTNAAEWTTMWTTEMAMDFVFRILGGAIASLVIIFVFAIITAWLYRKSLGMLASKSGVGLFSTAGLLLLIGAVLTIILVGAIIIWIAILLVAVAFFSMKPPVETTQPTPP